MKCMECGSALKTKRENIKYDASGLPFVTLMNVEVRRCPQCGAFEVVIPRIEGLHRLLAEAVIAKPNRLAPAEIRFLRRYMGWSGADFARYMGTTPETVSRWETGSTSMGVTADRLLRLMIAHASRLTRYSLDMLKSLERGTPKPVRVGAKLAATGWRRRAA